MAAPSSPSSSLSDEDLLLLADSEPESSAPPQPGPPTTAMPEIPRPRGVPQVRQESARLRAVVSHGRPDIPTEAPLGSMGEDAIRYGIPLATTIALPMIPGLGTAAVGAVGTIGRAMQAAGSFGLGDLIAKHILGEPVRPGEVGTGMALAGGGQVLGEVGPALMARIGGFLGRISPAALKATREASGAAGPVSEQSFLMSKPHEMAERSLGTEVAQATDEALGSLPQLKPPPETSESMQAAADARAVAAERNAEEHAAQSTRIVRASKATGTAAAKARSADNLASISNRIEDHLSQNERMLTAERGLKEQMLNDAGARGVTIDPNPLLDQVNRIDDSLAGSAMSEDVAARQELGRVRQTLYNMFGRSGLMDLVPRGQAAAGPLRSVTPIEADRLLIRLQRAHTTYGEVGQTIKELVSGGLAKFWKGRFYPEIENIGGVSGQIARKMRVMDELRSQMTSNPSAFGKRILGTGAGSREAASALSDYEAAFGTDGALRGQLDRFAADNADAINGINARHQRAADLVKSKRDAELADIEKAHTRELEGVRRVRALEQGNPEPMFKSQPSTPAQRATFEATQRLRSFMIDKTAESFVDSLWSGDEPAQSALQALRDFEKATGSNGSLESRLWRLHIRRQWTGPLRSEARTIRATLERSIVGRPMAKAGVVLQRPLGRVFAAGAASTIIPSKEQSQ